MSNYTKKIQEYRYGSSNVIISNNLTSVLNIYTAHDPTNCKLSYINGIGSIHGFVKKDKLEILNLILKDLKGSVILNTTNQRVANFIKKNYPTYYYHKVPSGYYGKYQYHICIKNTINVNNNCREPELETSLL